MKEEWMRLGTPGRNSMETCCMCSGPIDSDEGGTRCTAPGCSCAMCGPWCIPGVWIYGSLCRHCLRWSHGGKGVECQAGDPVDAAGSVPEKEAVVEWQAAPEENEEGDGWKMLKERAVKAQDGPGMKNGGVVMAKIAKR